MIIYCAAKAKQELRGFGKREWIEHSTQDKRGWISDFTVEKNKTVLAIRKC